MSRQMVQTFFPAVFARAEHNQIGYWILNCRFPVKVAEMCPEAVYKVQSYDIRLPYLGASAIFGIAIGASGAILLRCKLRKQNSNSTTEYCNLYLIVAYATFGAMNLCGLFIHCIWQAPDPSYPVSTPVLWALDCFFTGISATSLGFASVDSLLSTNSSKRWLHCTFVLLQTVGVIFLLNFLVVGETTMLLELWYLIPPIPVGWIILFDLSLGALKRDENESNVIEQLLRLHRALWIRSGQEWPLAIFLLGCMFALGGVIFDAPACYAIVGSTHFLDLPTATTCLFLGCDIAFAGLLLLWYHRIVDGAGNRDVFRDDSKKSD